MFWSRKKPPTIKCNFEEYPIIASNNEIYDQSVATIRRIFYEWIKCEVRYIQHGYSMSKMHLVHTLSTGISIRMLPYNDYEAYYRLLEAIKAPIYDSDGVASRFLDQIHLIQMTIPIEIQRLITGKFLYTMLTGIVIDVDHGPNASLEEWEYVLRVLPWVPYLVFYQETANSKEVSDYINAHTEKPIDANTVTATR